LWIVPVEVKVQIRRPRVIEDYYTVSLNTLIAKVNQSIEGSINNINLEIEKYLARNFRQRVDVFFANLDAFLHNYRDNLSQAQADQKLSLEEKEKLVEELSFLLPEATAQIQTAETYIEYTDQLLSDKPVA